MSVAYLAAAIKNRGQPVQIIDAANYTFKVPSNWSWFESNLKSWPYPPSPSTTKKHSPLHKEVDPEMIVMSSVAHATVASLTCAHQLEVEYVAIGVGEEKLPLMVEALEQNRDVCDIPGI